MACGHPILIIWCQGLNQNVFFYQIGIIVVCVIKALTVVPILITHSYKWLNLIGSCPHLILIVRTVSLLQLLIGHIFDLFLILERQFHVAYPERWTFSKWHPRIGWHRLQWLMLIGWREDTAGPPCGHHFQEKLKGYIILAGDNSGSPWLVGGIT